MTGEPITILYVEDDPAHAEIAMRNLKNSRIANRIFHVTDGQQALDYIFRQGDFAEPDTSPRPHMMLLDLRLPKVDGLEVMKRIKADPEFSDLPVVILTTSEAESDIIKAYSYQASSYLVKPLDFSKFNELLEAFGFYWLMWNKYPR
jgi:CheY-like chemotaxis protein